METKRQQFERETGQSPYLNPLKEVHGYAEWLEKQLEVRAISDQEIDIMGNKRTDLENVGERIAFKKGMLALRDLMNDRAGKVCMSMNEPIKEELNDIIAQITRLRIILDGEATVKKDLYDIETSLFKFRDNFYPSTGG